MTPLGPWFLIITVGGFSQTFAALSYSDCLKVAGRPHDQPGVVFSCQAEPIEGWDFWRKLKHD